MKSHVEAIEIVDTIKDYIDEADYNALVYMISLAIQTQAAKAEREAGLAYSRGLMDGRRSTFTCKVGCD